MEARKVIDSSTPLISLTAGEFRQVLRDALLPPQRQEPATGTSDPTPRRYVYGITGIAQLLGVSKPTAQRYKETFLKPAVMQRGRKLITDADMAVNLFAQQKGGER